MDDETREEEPETAPEPEKLPGGLVIHGVRVGNRIGVSIEELDGQDPFAVPGLLEKATQMARRQLGL